MVESVSINEFLEGDIIIDVRTPAEFGKGHIPGAHNVPLFSNEERVVVGTLYIKTGREQAIEKGLEFVGPRLTDIVRQAKNLADGKSVYIYCWRGGMRSGSVGWLLSTAGLDVKLLRGGYKTYRRQFEQMLGTLPWQLVLLSGSTGSGKTELLHHLTELGEQTLDLEGLANHKGSVFGALGQRPQPTTEHFINLLHERFLDFDPSRRIWCEGESMAIGHVFLPQRLFEIMHSGRHIEIEMSVPQRLDRLMIEYGDFQPAELIPAFEKIKKRFGPDRVKIAIEHLQQGEIYQAAQMALEYYDKAYRKTANTTTRINFAVDNHHLEQDARKLVSLIDDLAFIESNGSTDNKVVENI